jgi:hypothetical protein
MAKRRRAPRAREKRTRRPRTRANPSLVTYLANPQVTPIGGAVQAIVYWHAEDGKPYVHPFGGVEPELLELEDGSEWLRLDTLPRRTGVTMVGVGEGKALVVEHARGKAVWKQF